MSGDEYDIQKMECGDIKSVKADKEHNTDMKTQHKTEKTETWLQTKNQRRERTTKQEHKQHTDK